MNALRPLRIRGSVLLLLGLLLATPVQAGASERIFAEGFDSCCQIGGAVSASVVEVGVLSLG